jgi:glucose/mannose-6-phosphate isomerase
MNLDDLNLFTQLDPQNMLAKIDSLPDQLESAWELGLRQPLPGWQGLQAVLVAGMGGSAIGADLLAAACEGRASVPVIVHRDYGLPAWARGPHTLLVASSHSGNTEETLSAFEQAVAAGCRCLAVTTGGELARQAEKAGAPAWVFEHPGPPRAAVGYSFGLLLALMARLGLIADPAEELQDALAAMRRQQAHINARVPVVQNPAKRMAGQLMGRWTAIVGAGLLAPVARRWKCQINELAKAWAQFETMPEADHNTLAGLLYPQDLLPHVMALFLRAPSDHPRNRLRLDLTRKAFMLEGLNTDFIDAQGDTPLAHQWTALHFGDYLSYYLAMAYGVDPTPITPIENFKREMLS